MFEYLENTEEIGFKEKLVEGLEQNNYILMLTTRKIDIGPIVFKPKTELYVKQEKDDLYIKSENFDMRTSISDLEKRTKSNFVNLFVSKEDAEKAINYGSEIKLLTNDGLLEYSVEDISFKDGKTTYVTLGLKVL